MANDNNTNILNLPTEETLQTIATTLQTMQGNVSGVKGNEEVTYRTGQVNLTAANVGALAANTTYVSSVNGSSGAVTGIATQQGLEEVRTIAEGANAAMSFTNYVTMISDLDTADEEDYKLGQSIYIATLDVPDLWIYEVTSIYNPYTYTTDEAFLQLLAQQGYVQIGYYKVAALETQKVDLTNYVTLDGTQTITGAKTFTQGINLGSGATITKDSSNRVALSYNDDVKVKVGSAETTFKNRIGADSDNSSDIGRAAVRFKDLYLSGSLSDGTNSRSVADILNCFTYYGEIDDQTDASILEQIEVYGGIYIGAVASSSGKHIILRLPKTDRDSSTYALALIESLGGGGAWQFCISQFNKSTGVTTARAKMMTGVVHSDVINTLNMNRSNVKEYVVNDSGYVEPKTDLSPRIGSSTKRFSSVYTSKLGNQNATYGLTLPDMTSWTADKELATNDIISDAYDNTATYAVGDCCIYNNTLYKCNTAITTAEDFDDTKWNAITITELISDETIVRTTGDQTVAGKKKFTGIPEAKEMLFRNNVSSPTGSSLSIQNDNGYNAKIRFNNRGFMFTAGSVYPTDNNVMDFGATNYLWKNIYVSGNLSNGTNSVTVALLSGVSGAYATNSTTELKYSSINNISISADTTYTLATAPTGTYPEYKANITNTDTSNAITITLPSGTIIKGNVTISSNTFEIPADSSVEVNIQNDKALVMNWSA